MNEYHKIPTVFQRDPATKFRTLSFLDRGGRRIITKLKAKDFRPAIGSEE